MFGKIGKGESSALHSVKQGKIEHLGQGLFVVGQEKKEKNTEVGGYFWGVEECCATWVV